MNRNGDSNASKDEDSQKASSSASKSVSTEPDISPDRIQPEPRPIFNSTEASANEKVGTSSLTLQNDVTQAILRAAENASYKASELRLQRPEDIGYLLIVKENIIYRVPITLDGSRVDESIRDMNVKLSQLFQDPKDKKCPFSENSERGISVMVKTKAAENIHENLVETFKYTDWVGVLSATRLPKKVRRDLVDLYTNPQSSVAGASQTPNSCPKRMRLMYPTYAPGNGHACAEAADLRTSFQQPRAHFHPNAEMRMNRSTSNSMEAATLADDCRRTKSFPQQNTFQNLVPSRLNDFRRPQKSMSSSWSKLSTQEVQVDQVSNPNSRPWSDTVSRKSMDQSVQFAGDMVDHPSKLPFLLSKKGTDLAMVDAVVAAQQAKILQDLQNQLLFESQRLTQTLTLASNSHPINQRHPPQSLFFVHKNSWPFTTCHCSQQAPFSNCETECNGTAWNTYTNDSQSENPMDLSSTTITPDVEIVTSKQQGGGVVNLAQKMLLEANGAVAARSTRGGRDESSDGSTESCSSSSSNNAKNEPLWRCVQCGINFRKEWLLQNHYRGQDHVCKLLAGVAGSEGLLRRIKLFEVQPESLVDPKTGQIILDVVKNQIKESRSTCINVQNGHAYG